MKNRYIVMLATLCSCWSLAAHADRDTGWEFGGELIYQDSQDLSGDNGSTAAIDSDVGLALTFGYRVNERLVVNFGIDWNNVDYQAFLVSEDFPNLSATVDGELECRLDLRKRFFLDGIQFRLRQDAFLQQLEGL